ncbi:hypothetical protein [Terriglobus sp. RCC_193]|uniref:hypothetical protein n=1 Tax=Terriglobus sp. RCC_193 TaxID=3239218 RepID=UPI00352410A0
MTTILNPTPSVNIPPPTPGLRSPSLRDLLNIAFYYRRLAFLLATVLLLIGVLVALLLPPSYMARARLLALNGGVYDLQSGGIPNARSLTAPPAADVEQQLLESAELHRDVIRRELGARVSSDVFDKRLTEFESHLKVSKLETGDVIEVTYRDRDPQRAAAALKTLLAVYFEERSEILTSGRVAFLTQQRDNIRAQLDAANGQIEAYEKQHGVVDVKGQIDSAVQLDGQLRQRMAEAETAVADARRTVDVLQSNASRVPQEVELYRDNTEAARTIGTMEADLFKLHAKRADLMSRYLPTSPFVTQVDAQIAQLETSIEQQKKQVSVATRVGYNNFKDQINGQLSQAQATLAGAQGRYTVLQTQVAASQGKLKDLVSVNDTLARLTSQRDLLAETAKNYAEQVEKARVEQNQTMTSGTTNVRMIETPTVPRKRTNSRLLFIAAAIVASLLITIVVIVVASSMRETFLSPDEAERSLRLPVLSDIARRSAPEQTARRAFGRLIAAADSVPTGGQGKAILLLTAQNEGGMSLVARGLTEALEPRSPGRVALVRMEENGDTPIEGSSLALRPLTKDAVITVGMTMTRSRLINLFHELRSTYDYIVVTAPPAYQWFESLELTTVADLTVLILAAEVTRKPVAETILSQASYIGGNVDGLVMTGRKYYIPGWLYRLLLGRGTA